MKKSDWPIRWDLLLRYRLIEIIALWEGRLTTNHICHGFGIGRQQASKDINTYLRELAPDNLEYDRHLKGYVPSARFTPVVTKGQSAEYLDLLARHDTLSQTFESLHISLPQSTVLHASRPLGQPAVVRTVVAAARQKKPLELEYVSLTAPDPVRLVIEPHSLVFSHHRWLARGWCREQQGFGNFNLNHIRGLPKIINQRFTAQPAQDDAWNGFETLTLRPDPRLSAAQQAIVAQDYGMVNKQLRIRSRKALVDDALQQLGIHGTAVHPDPLVQQIQLSERDANNHAQNTPRPPHSLETGTG
ncbi:WYL domain-containing protein [Marinobacter sp. X15-166B]|uniref:WYL domain-containing protein n=1 Tax=Marinobacter sp. X15-166B TaxID=1897620 RepID=UPI00085C5F46|nr:WYL domain-containing protein [Marinobacter sp. X15-166B]OEY66192.1 hypothetical protein BG841_06785 [Marinobacter sp. X15-166B]